MVKIILLEDDEIIIDGENWSGISVMRAIKAWSKLK